MIIVTFFIQIEIVIDHSNYSCDIVLSYLNYNNNNMPVRGTLRDVIQNRVLQIIIQSGL